jgi:8-oxo-dGTP pyrophosphatase MutT (NUDIX family)
MIQRKSSLAFVEFIRGKYSTHDDTYLSLLLEGMTQEEHEMMRTMTFHEMWHAVWGESSERRSHRNDYDTSERRYLAIEERLQELLRGHPTKWTEPEWGFPKGRRNPYETDMHCAMREFQEETGLRGVDYTVLSNVQPISESFFGCNQVHYCHTYYLAVCREDTEVGMHLESRCMTREVRDIAWCSMEEAMARIRPDNVEKREVLLKAGKILKNFHPLAVPVGR